MANTEKEILYAHIEKLTPIWQSDRDSALRAGRMNVILNNNERDSFAPIDRLLDEIIELNKSVRIAS